METHYYSQHNSPIGPLNIAVSERGLMLLEFDRGQFPPQNGKFVNALWKESAKKTIASVRQLKEYFARQRRSFTVPLDLRGTSFQKRCWQALLEIPYGETRTYAEMARAIGHPQAFRAVGMANHDNPVAVIVPCHRVIASDGTLGGYGGGLRIKQRLLDLEGARWGAQVKVHGQQPLCWRTG
jgi:methylated-DNA-[protein]-cysteine S-methyltransferase